MTNSRPVDSLTNLSLTDGYDVVKRINPPVQATGGKFSVQYLVKKENKEYWAPAAPASCFRKKAQGQEAGINPPNNPSGK